MKKISSIFLLIVMVRLAAQATDGARAVDLVLTHITVVDTITGQLLPDRTVAIHGNRIGAITDGTGPRMSKDAQVIDETGKFLIPGLWDMHVHPHGRDYLPLFIANGVTGIRVMWGNPENFEWRKDIQAGLLIGPRMTIASTIIDGARPFWPGSIAVHNEAEAREAVDGAKAIGVDFVKVYSFLTREEYFAIADEAKKQGIPFAGHVPIAVTAEEAAKAGQKSVEHLTGVLPACSTLNDKWNAAGRADLDDYLRGGPRLFEGARQHALREEMIGSYSPQKAAALFEVFKKNETWQVPTLTLWRMFSSLTDPGFTNDPRLKFVPVRERESWNPAEAAKESVADNTALSQKDFMADEKVVGAMQKAGVRIMAGTDTGNPFCISGFALHDELKLLVQSGLTPLEALQSATLNPARFMGKEGDFGTVAEGKISDLVVLEANPFDDIANTEKISVVIFDGKFISKSEINAMLKTVDALANRTPIGTVMSKTIEEKNVGAAIEQFRELKKREPEAYDFSEGELVGLGYQLIHVKKYKDAIEVFKLSVETYPTSYNSYDSLGEAYMDNGDKDLAIQNYKKSVQLNPANENGVNMLKKLGVQGLE